MSNDSLIERWFAAGDAGDVASFDRYLHPGVVVHAPLGLATTGIEAERQAWSRVLAGFPDLRHDVQEVLAAGSTLAARVVVTGTQRGEFLGMPGSGKRFRIDQAVWAHVRDGKADEVWEIVDSASLLEQLGGLAPA